MMDTEKFSTRIGMNLFLKNIAPLSLKKRIKETWEKMCQVC